MNRELQEGAVGVDVDDAYCVNPNETPPHDHSRQSPRLAYSTQEVAAMLNISTKTVRRLVCRGLLKPSRALRHLRFSREEVQHFLATTV